MKKLSNICMILLSTLIILILYTLIHEGGHTLFAILFGGRVTEFNINFLGGSPHVSWVGDLENYQRAIISVAGPLVPYLLWAAAMLIFRKNQNNLYKMAIFTASMGILGSFIPNIIISILYAHGENLQNEDIARFIEYSGVNCYLTALMAAILLAVGIILVVKNINFKELYRNVLDSKPVEKTAAAWVISAAVIIILIYSCINIFNSSIQNNSLKPPKEYDKLIALDLSSIGESKSTVYEFEISEPRMYDFYIIGDTKEKVELKLKGTGNMPNLRVNEMNIYSAAGKSNSSFTNWCLDKGKYTIELIKQGSGGNIKTYITGKKIEDLSEIMKYSNENIFNGNIPEMDSGYVLILKDKLSDEINQNIYEFSLQQDKNVQFSVFLTTKNGRAVLKLSGNGNEEELISEYQVFTLGRGVDLRKGDYKLLLTSSGCDGEIYIFMKR